MAYLQFNKEELVNLEYSLKRELLSTNHAGGYLNTTIVGCNTRKYHGLLVVPVDNFGGGKYILLSSLDETIVQHQKEFNLGIHRYGYIYEPRGHKYICNFEIDKVAATTYQVGGVLLRKVLVLCNEEEQVFIKYTLLEAHSPTILRLKPFLAFRNIHSLSKANINAERKFRDIKNGKSFKMYEGFPDLNLQLNVKSEFISNPDWYYNIEYKEESRRAYDSTEDLFVPGYFELPIRKGQTIIFSASTKEEDPSRLSYKFTKSINQKSHRNSFESCLQIAAKQFIIHNNGDTDIYAGYPWLEKNIRDTLIALPGLTWYSNGDLQTFRDVLETVVRRHGDYLVKTGKKVDVPLWFFWTLQHYAKALESKTKVWKEYKELLVKILNSYKDGSRKNVNMHENGLLWAEERGIATSWMDAYVSGAPVTERAGYQVELNSLWYNAICFALEMASKSRERAFINEWTQIKGKIEKNFIKAFWIESIEHLADYVGPEGQNKFVRPNQLFTCAFDFSPINDEIKSKVLQCVKQELLTARGIRTLSPKNPKYKGEYDGDQFTRDMAYHQGTTRVWLLGFYIEASLKLYGGAFINTAKELIQAFEEDLTIHCIGSISEVYDGDPPHQPHGCTSYSNSISAILRAMRLIEQFNNSEP
ncbi:MAG: amylo-alpha-1,6-glucosidase [Bacteroidales bacterium]